MFGYELGFGEEEEVGVFGLELYMSSNAGGYGCAIT